MKTLGGIITIVLLALLMISGVSLIFNQAGVTGNLDTESQNLIGLYDDNFDTLNDDYDGVFNTSKGLTEFEPDGNLIGDEVKEYFAHKSRIDQLRDTVNLAYKLPDILFLSLPFVDYEDTAVYRNVTWFFIWVSIFVAIILALRQGKVTEEN